MFFDNNAIQLDVKYRKYIEITRNEEIIHHNAKQFINTTKIEAVLIKYLNENKNVSKIMGFSVESGNLLF